MLTPMLDELIRDAAETGAKEVLLGMAHRGRLNVLAHILGKPYAAILSEFHLAPNKDLVPSEGSMGINYGWTGDVKYHLGARRTLRDGVPATIQLTMANNPSHLEFVNPVVEGFTRAAQDKRDAPGAPVTESRRRLGHRHSRRRGVPWRGRRRRDAQPLAAARLPDRRHDSSHRQQPGRLHHRAERGALDPLRRRPRQGLRDSHPARQRRRSRRLPRRRAPGADVPAALPPRLPD